MTQNKHTPSDGTDGVVVVEFGGPATFRLLEAGATPGSALTLSRADGKQNGLRLTFQRTETDPPEVTAAIGLPIRGIDGPSGRVRLEASCDRPDLRFRLHGLDGAGEAGTVEFNKTGMDDSTAYVAALRDVSEAPNTEPPVSADDTATLLAFPLELHRLSITIPAEANSVDVTLLTLVTTGKLTLIPTGLA